MTAYMIWCFIGTMGGAEAVYLSMALASTSALIYTWLQRPPQPFTEGEWEFRDALWELCEQSQLDDEEQAVFLSMAAHVRYKIEKSPDHESFETLLKDVIETDPDTD